ncbi:hypothetical protein PSP20601_03767 [Pandoraea sputorum]|nr:hypothetical protein PSP20601_03767 [Pandoraea sputorum]
MRPPVFAKEARRPLSNGVGGHKAGLRDRNTGTGRAKALPTKARPLIGAREGMTDEKIAACGGCPPVFFRLSPRVTVVSVT